jgi:serralysin
MSENFEITSFDAAIDDNQNAGNGTVSAPSYAPDTVPADITTPEGLNPGDDAIVSIDTLGDHDWYGVTLVAGRTYVFETNSSYLTGALSDSFITLRNSVGAIVVSNDDKATFDPYSLIIYTPTTSGEYFIDVGAYADAGIGTVSIRFAESLASGGDTIAGDFTTTGTIALGGSINGTINALGDHDWYAISMTAGQSVLLRTNTVAGGGVADTTLTVHNNTGTVLAFNDDGPNGDYLSQLRFTATTTGTYYVDVAAFNEFEVGAFNLTMETPPPLTVFTNDQIATQLTTGYWGPGNDRHFNVAPGGTLTVNVSALSAAGQNLAREALNLWTDATGITFSETLATAQITFSNTGTGAFASSVFSGGITSNATVNVGTQWLIDYGTTLNSYSFQTFVHEIGHALGLGHGGNYNGTANYDADALYLNDSWATTIMSYFDQNENLYFKNQGFTRQYMLSPVVADGIAVSNLYGVNTLTRTGNTIYGFNDTSGRAIYNAALNANVSYTIFDNGGIDTLDYSNYSGAPIQVINLNAESFSSVLGRTGNVTIARGTIIENAIGGNNTDRIFGNAANNNLQGGNGADFIDGGAGSDTINGGAGIDRAVYTSAQGAIFADLAAQSVNETALQTGTVLASTAALSTDTLVSIEDITGSNFGDRIYGNSLANLIDGSGGDDVVYAEDGDDTVIGGAGGDMLFGGLGTDLLDYSSALGAIFADITAFVLETSLQIGTVTATSTLLSTDYVGQFENITGSARGDRLYGTNGSNTLNGGGGNDIIYAEGGDDIVIGGAGDDIMLGGSGTDTLNYSSAVGAVYVSLDGFANETALQVGTVNANTATLSVDLLAQFENIIGSEFGDRLYGGAGVNTINGGGGDDIIYGGAGSDVLIGGAGNDRIIGEGGADTLTGGAGADTFFFTSADGSSLYNITDFVAGTDKLQFLAPMLGLTATSPVQLFVNPSPFVPGSSGAGFFYQSATGILGFDIDGNGPVQAVVFGNIGTGLALTTADFVLYG